MLLHVCFIYINYMKNVYETLKGGQIGDTKIDKKKSNFSNPSIFYAITDKN